jgi:hypothetical protein
VVGAAQPAPVARGWSASASPSTPPVSRSVTWDEGWDRNSGVESRSRVSACCHQTAAKPGRSLR